mmetsp:Transcript_44257/g.109999  ORF Transcript_44257/g.109999 Transcript_44257/m.109999 type:complete len:124 (+) Transcript_44257:249-620(+)
MARTIGQLQWLWGVAELVWAYVLLTPAGTVYEPLDLVGEATDREPTGDDGSPSKLVDVKHLACGLLLQTAGLLSALRLSGGQGTVSPPWSWVAWARASATDFPACVESIPAAHASHSLHAAQR